MNGCGIARDAAGRGFSVMLAEMDDLASGTSSAATKLVHGGLRYLEYYEFRLVHEALAEREVLWAAAPHIIWPLRFVLPHHKGLRPALVLRAGLFIYDYLGGRKLLPPTKTLDLAKDAAGKPLKDGLPHGVRIFRLLGQRCPAGGARAPATPPTAAPPSAPAPRWCRRGATTASVADRDGGHRQQARETVHRPSCWSMPPAPGSTMSSSRRWARTARSNVRLVKGSHIVIKKHFEHDRCYIFQNARWPHHLRHSL